VSPTFSLKRLSDRLAMAAVVVVIAVGLVFLAAPLLVTALLALWNSTVLATFSS